MLFAKLAPSSLTKGCRFDFFRWLWFNEERFLDSKFAFNLLSSAREFTHLRHPPWVLSF